MKLFILLVCLATYVLSQKAHCIEHSFSVRSVFFAPGKEYDDEHMIFFDVDRQMQRLDIHEFDPEKKKTAIIMRFDLNKTFILNKDTKQCEVQPLEGPMVPFCLAGNATHAGQLTLGGRMKCDIWEQQAFGFDTRYVFACASGVLINIFSKGTAHHEHSTALEEWFDYQHGVSDVRVFDIPEECKTSTIIPNSSSRLWLKKTLQKHVWMRHLYN